jgi:hypothetical protein
MTFFEIIRFLEKYFDMASSLLSIFKLYMIHYRKSIGVHHRLNGPTQSSKPLKR